MIFKLGGIPAPDYDDAVWLDHVRAGELFNHAVTNARLTSYFDNATGVLSTRCPGSLYSDDGYGLDYIVPGDEPDTEADRIAYCVLFHAMKARDSVIEELRDAMRRLASSSAHHELADQSTKEGQNHVEGRQRPRTVAAE